MEMLGFVEVNCVPPQFVGYFTSGSILYPGQGLNVFAGLKLRRSNLFDLI
jgi:hypothetical protein